MYMYAVHHACTSYSCQVATEKLTRERVAEQALALADAEGLDAVTIRRLAQELGVTAMALYWHFKNKDELLLGMVDHVMAEVRPPGQAARGWQPRLRTMVEALVAVMREHPSLSDLFPAVDKEAAPGFARAVNDALDLLTQAGFDLPDGYWVASYLLHGVIGLVAAQPGCPGRTPQEAAERRRQRRLAMESLPADAYPMVVAFARTLEAEPDIERYFAFGVDMLLAGVRGMAERTESRPGTRRPARTG